MAADWSPDLIVNDEGLDRDHVELFRRIAVAAEALHGARAVLDDAVAALAATLVEHLAREERMMEVLEYPERARHRMAHELFMSDFDRMRAALTEAGPDPVVAEWLANRIPEWLRFHIRVNDAPLARWCAAKQRGGERRRAGAPSRRAPRPS